MIIRRYHIVIVILASLFAFGGTITPETPRERVRTEVVLKLKSRDENLSINRQAKQAARVIETCLPVTSSSSQLSRASSPYLVTSYHQYYRSLLINSQHHHSTL